MKIDPTPPEPKPELKLPTDAELRHMVFSMWYDGLNLERFNISACTASRMKIPWSEEFDAAIYSQLKRLVREGELRRQRFLPGRPYYTIP